MPWLMLVILALGRWRLEDCEVVVSLDLAGLYLKTKQKEKKKKHTEHCTGGSCL
jgi:hypothetical protein